ncbi:MAG: hypothetical protein EGR80_07560 [Ruminiclostridium sp.]|nr:hypothetical protein [Ruminiclostridium sp.]
MEYIDRIFYRKINPSDFKKLYDIDKPDSGGGQTYLEAAGIPNDDIVDFLEYAEISDSTLSDETRFIYTFNAYVLGNSSEKAFIEFAPRGGRNNYRISRQNMRYKHPAWSLENGFPEPNRNADGKYTSDGNFEGIIDNLVIMILRTTHKKYYAGFINSAGMPTEWPVGIGLERMFEGERRGVIKLATINVAFIDSLACPFGEYDTVTRVQGGTNIILYGVPGAGKSWTIKNDYCNDANLMERLVFHPDYTYSDFVGQILPTVAEDGSVSYVFTPGPFTKLVRKAYLNPDKMFYLVIEEINRGNAPAIFGDIFQLLDRNQSSGSEYEITNADIARIVYEDDSHKVSIPSNMSILCTMNTSDQNVFTLDTAFQRRWNMRLIKNRFQDNQGERAFAETKILDTSVSWEHFFTEINKIVLTKNIRMTSSEDKRLGTHFVSKEDLLMGDGSERQISRFPEKVLKYLWDDAFKFTKEDVFDLDKVKSLEDVIELFVSSEKDDRFLVFKENIFNTLVPKKSS